MKRSVLTAWALAACAAPVLAQEAGPTSADVYAAFVGAVPQMEVTGSFYSEDSAQAGRLFLTMILAELGGGAESLGDEASLRTSCEAAVTPGVWECRMSLGIKWDDAESAYIASFEMAATDVACSADALDVAPQLYLCGWQIVENRVRIDLIG